MKSNYMKYLCYLQIGHDFKDTNPITHRSSKPFLLSQIQFQKYVTPTRLYVRVYLLSSCQQPTCQQLGQLSSTMRANRLIEPSAISYNLLLNGACYPWTVGHSFSTVKLLDCWALKVDFHSRYASLRIKE